jgi:hypothetical protein
MNLPVCDEPLPPDPIRPSRAATIIGVSLKSVYRWIRHRQIHAWRDLYSGRLLVSEAEVRGRYQEVSARARAQEQALLEVRKRLKLEAG